MKAKKSLGQHFLKSERALREIIETARLVPGETVLEIGPGTGILTERLLAAGAHVVAVEKDDHLFKLLKEKYKTEIESNGLNLIHDDILKFNSTYYLLLTTYYKLIANIPYNITGAIFQKFLSAEYQPSLMVLLVQKEVAQRIVASDGKESILSISVKAYGTPRYVDTVKAGSFAPAPTVDSAIIAVDSISKQFFEGFSEEQFFHMLRAGFHSKRKKLSSNLALLYGKEKIQETFEKLGLSANIRAEEVNSNTWLCLAEAIL